MSRRYPSCSCGLFTAILIIAGLATSAVGQEPITAPLVSRQVATPVDSGLARNDGNAPKTVFSTVIQVSNAEWLRLNFDQVVLAGNEQAGTGSYLLITSLLDGASQRLHAGHVAQWQNTSAYFNGDAVRIELVAHPGTGNNRVAIGETTASATSPGPRSICGSTDDRILSSDPRAGRALPVGCTAWLINDAANCFLTAGHCTGNLNVVEFNVPLSSSGGSLNHPPPEDQYSVDPASMQSNGGQGVGNDWGYFGCFPNSNTGLTAAQAQGDFYILSATPPPVAGQDIRITGYGTVSSPVPQSWRQVQKTHAGPYFAFFGTTVQYTTDTSGGNSGSPVINEATGETIGIHTHGGCSSTSGNSGTGINHPGLQNALANPQGVCRPLFLGISFPNGRPGALAPSGGTSVNVVVVPGSLSPAPGSGLLHYNEGAGFVSIPMQQITPNVYDAVFPAIPCGTEVEYYVSAQTTSGIVVNEPFNAPNSVFRATSAVSITTVASYDFESGLGWVVQNVSLADGAWNRGVPVNCNRGDPPTDFDGSGQCFLTDNSAAAACNSDVDGGPTQLISPAFDLSGTTQPVLSYARWFTNDDLDGDRMDVHISDDGGLTWVPVETVAHTVGWVVKTWNITNLISLTSTVRVRFSATDNPNDSVTEAALDAFSITDIVCNAPVVCTKGDVNQDQVINGGDIGLFTDTLISGGTPGTVAFCATDMDDDGVLEVGDDVSLFVTCLLDGPCP